VIIDVATDQTLDIDEFSATTFNNAGFYVPLNLNPSESPSAVAWAPDDKSIYVGYLTGPQGSFIEGNGTVRKCVFYDPPSIVTPRCWHAVAVRAPVRSLAVTPDGNRVWVGDASGWLTPLEEDWFEAGPTTSGVNNVGLFDGTGGCLELFGGDLRATECMPAACMASPLSIANEDLGDGRDTCGESNSFGLDVGAIAIR